MRKIFHFHGTLGREINRTIEIVCDTVAEGMEALSRQLPELAPDPIRGMRSLKVLGFNSIESLFAPTDKNEIHIVDALNFGKDSGLLQVIIGTTLIVAGVLVNFIPGGSALSPYLISAGVSLVIGGVMTWLTPQPDLGGADEEEKKSRYLPVAQNTVAIGTRIPILYGEHRVGGHILSVNIDTRGTV